MYAGVTEQVLDKFRVRASREQQSGARVTEIVPAYIRQSHTP
jgi:hypothetical protein